MDTYEPISFDKIIPSDAFGAWSWERETNALFFNASYMRMLGYAHDSFPFHISTWINLLHPEDREKALAKQQAVLENASLGDTFEDTFRMRAATGGYLRIYSRGFVLCRDTKGKALRMCGTHLDQSVLEQTLENLSTQHDRMLFALEAANDGLWDWNPKTDEVYYSPRYIAMLGYQPQEFPPNVESWTGRIHPDDLAKTIETQREYIRSSARGDSFDCVYRFLDANGTYRWILGRGKITKRDENGRGIRVVGMHTDVTELRNAQEALVKLLHRDTLTQLYSRFYFDSTLDKITPEDYPLSIIYGDLDGLKMVNDILGHADGDKMLIDAAALLQQALPPDAVAARLGGDEFAVLLRKTTRGDAEAVLLRIEERIAKHNEHTPGVPVLLSMGIVASERGASIYKLLSRADEAMLENKKAQRGNRRRALLSYIEKAVGEKIAFHDNRLSAPDETADL